ncbi:EndoEXOCELLULASE [Umbelopsis sp. PMI_123]|nr:EndoEXOCELLULASE [Umbelopsis sp. PMI_123]
MRLSIFLAASLAISQVAAANQNYALAFQTSIHWFEAQTSGTKPSWSTITWRGNSALLDGKDHGLDLTGGWYDAGDHVKFGLPMAYTTTILAWGMIEYGSTYDKYGQTTYFLNNLRVALDYFIKAHPSANVFYGQVGDGSADHAFWGAPENLDQVFGQRPSYAINTTCPGSELAGETAAAMAAASILFQSSDPTYAAALLAHSKTLYNFADTYRGKYDSCIPASGFYTSYSGYNDELAWGAMWLYKATNDSTYATKAQTAYATLSTVQGSTNHSFAWTSSWDDKSYACYVLGAKLFGDTVGNLTFALDAQRNLDWWTVGVGSSKVTYSPGGQAWLDTWGSTRYASTASFLALVYADHIGSSSPLYSRYHDFAKGQIDYILGNNPRSCSYLVGYGSCYPQTPHHRGSHGSWTNSLTNPVYQRHIVYGALVGGPGSANDQFTDDRSAYGTNEPACDYVSAFVGAAARLAQEYGGTTATSFPDKPLDDYELSVNASINAAGTGFTEIAAWFINKSGWPARVTKDLVLRYYFTLDGNTTASQISYTINYNQCGSNAVSGPFQAFGNVYYMNISCAGDAIYPGGQQYFQQQIQVRIISSGTWDPTNDWSYQGLTTSNQRVTNIPLFEGSTVVYGNMPNSTTTTTSTPTTTTTTTTSTTTSSTTTAPTTTATTTTTTTTKTTTTKTSTSATTTTSSSASCATHWGQCGGTGWTGPTCCESGYTCTVSNAYYSQCL